MDTCGAHNQLNTLPGEHKGGILSWLVSEEDNAVLADLIGNESTVLTAAVVQVFFALPEDRSQWTLCHHGVVCFIRDHGLRSYFLRVFNIKAQKLVWEQELYFEFRYKAPRPYLHTFPGENFQVALNFADEAEAENLKIFIEARIKRLQKIKRRKAGQFTQASSPLSSPKPQPQTTGFLSVERRRSSKRRLNKSDIGTPKDFKHVSHVGWNPRTGFNMNRMDPDLKQLFVKVGIRERHLKNKEMSQLIYEVIEKRGGMEAVRKEVHRQESLPPSHLTRLTSTPPFPRPSTLDSKLKTPLALKKGPLPALPVSSTEKRTPSWSQKVRGPPIHMLFLEEDIPPPPSIPPPPPPVVPPVAFLPPALPAAPPLPAVPVDAQLQNWEKQSGSTREHRATVLEQIKQGIRLKSITKTDSTDCVLPSPERGDLANALLEVIQKRQKAMYSSDEDDMGDSEDDFDEWD
ncbi:actin nucleation-promoting factor WASL-like [Erpetoichthys calabaricus]|uniref:actin nucleation-promoting factor WASL-like n=1 Tax=Erpetoichthys calabaricus TaxID=27687 RepID=UPI002233EAEC|nr:actin nucleation-promoting factor WASL-like [Erpetoichthys calabaricus]